MDDSEGPQSRVCSLDEFVELLTPDILGYIMGCVRGGLKDYDDPTNYGPQAKLAHTDSLRAQIRNGHMVARAERGLVELGGQVVSKRLHGRPVFIIRDIVRVNFKKFDKNLRTRNYPTKQARDFRGQRLPDQQPMLPFTGAGPVLTNVMAGYQFDAFEATYEIYIVCPRDEDHDWVLKLTGAAVDDFVADPAAHPLAEKIVSITRRRARVREGTLKRSDEQPPSA